MRLPRFPLRLAHPSDGGLQVHETAQGSNPADPRCRPGDRQDVHRLRSGVRRASRRLSWVRATPKHRLPARPSSALEEECPRSPRADQNRGKVCQRCGREGSLTRQHDWTNGTPGHPPRPIILCTRCHGSVEKGRTGEGRRDADTRLRPMTRSRAATFKVRTSLRKTGARFGSA
jgi:hypothetical protein